MKKLRRPIWFDLRSIISKKEIRLINCRGIGINNQNNLITLKKTKRRAIRTSLAFLTVGQKVFEIGKWELENCKTWQENPCRIQSQWWTLRVIGTQQVYQSQCLEILITNTKSKGRAAARILIGTMTLIVYTMITTKEIAEDHSRGIKWCLQAFRKHLRENIQVIKEDKVRKEVKRDRPLL